MRSIRSARVCVTGGAGFLGSHLVNHLIDDRNCDVLVIDNLIAGRREFIHPKAKFVYHDITGSEEYLRRIFEDCFENGQAQFVFNLAARPYVPDSYDRPIRTADVNFMGALKVINAAQEAGCEAILQVGSAEVFGNFSAKENPDGIDEFYPTVPHSTYGASKLAIDSCCQVAWRERGTPVIVLRQFNCYGPRPLHRYVIPEIIQQLHEHGPKLRLGNNSTRDFQYASDAVEQAVELLELGDFGEVFNMGAEDSIKIYDLARLIGKLMGFEEVEIEVDPSRIRPWEIWSLKAKCDKLYSVIPRRGRVSFEEGLKRTIVSFQQNEDSWSF
jgi:UDP-glucose 4-epimerase